MKPYLRLLCLTTFLMGCTSAPVGVNYYVLNATIQNAPAVVEVEAHKVVPTLVIESVELAGFLKQSGLVMQAGKNQLHLSKSHLWAERLDDVLPKVLQKNFQRLSPNYTYYLKSSDWIDKTDYRLRLRLDGLHATDEGEVIAAGRYQVISASDTQLNILKDFYFKRDLTEDGYGHAVAQIEQLVALIAEDIIASMEARFPVVE